MGSILCLVSRTTHAIPSYYDIIVSSLLSHSFDIAIAQTTGGADQNSAVPYSQTVTRKSEERGP